MNRRFNPVTLQQAARIRPPWPAWPRAPATPRERLQAIQELIPAELRAAVQAGPAEGGTGACWCAAAPPPPSCASWCRPAGAAAACGAGTWRRCASRCGRAAESPRWRAERTLSRMRPPHRPGVAALLKPALRALCASTLLLLFAGCSSLPTEVPRTESRALANTGDTRLGQACGKCSRSIRASPASAPCLSHEAFAARMLLAQAAQRSLDLQYYIWHARHHRRSCCGKPLWQAAERGVRVRLLLDDANTGGLDPMLAALDAHPNIELRLFNPFANRRLPGRRLRRRFLAREPPHAQQVLHRRQPGGDRRRPQHRRRVLRRQHGVGFQDLDVMAVGPVVREVSQRVRPVLEQRLRLSGRQPAGAGRRRRRGARCATTWQAVQPATAGAATTSRPCARRRWCAQVMPRAASTSSGPLRT